MPNTGAQVPFVPRHVVYAGNGLPGALPTSWPREGEILARIRLA